MEKKQRFSLLLLLAIMLAGFLVVDKVFAMDQSEEEMMKSCTPIIRDISEKQLGYEMQDISLELDSAITAQNIVSNLQESGLVRDRQTDVDSQASSSWLDEVMGKIKSIKFFE